jgi:hypothetical protein
VVGVDGMLSTDFQEPDPLCRLFAWIDDLSAVELHAKYLIRRAEPGDSLTYAVLRDGREEPKEVVLVRQGLSYPMSVFLGVALLLLASGLIWIWRSQLLFPSAVFASFGYLILLFYSRGSTYDLVAGLLDLCLALPLLAAWAIGRLPAQPIQLPGWWSKYRARAKTLALEARGDVPGEPGSAGAALSAIVATLVLLLVTRRVSDLDA